MLGDPDAVPVGDYHHPNTVAWALAGEPRADDDRMLELLEPYRGQRGRVLWALTSAAGPAPKYGPRQRILPMARWAREQGARKLIILSNDCLKPAISLYHRDERVIADKAILTVLHPGQRAAPAAAPAATPFAAAAPRPAHG